MIAIDQIDKEVLDPSWILKELSASDRRIQRRSLVDSFPKSKSNGLLMAGRLRVLLSEDPPTPYNEIYFEQG